MKQSPSFEFRIVGNELTPETLRLTDLAAVITEIEKAIAPVISRESPEAAENFIISLKSVEEGSAKLRLASPYYFRAAQAAFVILALAIKENAYTKLPEETQKSLHSLRQLSRKRNWTFELRKDARRKLPLAQITPSAIEPATRTIRGFTTIYGQIMRTGGIQPKVQIQFLDGNLISCEVDKATAISLGSHLYSAGRFEGEATWDLDDEYRIVGFRITDARDFVQAPVREAFNQLSEKIGKFFSDVDPDEFVAQLRRDN